MDLEKELLKKKLKQFGGLAIIGFGLGLVGSMGFVDSLIMGMVIGIIFYVPGRLKSMFGFGVLARVFVGVVYYAILIWAIMAMPVLGMLILSLPLADIGYSVYKVFFRKKKN